MFEFLYDELLPVVWCDFENHYIVSYYKKLQWKDLAGE